MFFNSMLYIFVCVHVCGYMCIWGGGCTCMYMNVEIRGQPWGSVLRHLLILFETGSHIVLEFAN